MNVGLTRPRSSLIVVGNSKALKTNPDWRALVNHSAEKDACIVLPFYLFPFLFSFCVKVVK
jgi:superfamily I DNA and/or RNA helicase